MIRLEYFLVCNACSVDLHTGELSLFHIVEDLFPKAMPYTMPQIVAVSCWSAEGEDRGQDFQATLTVAPAGEEGKSFPQNFTLDRKRIHTLHRVGNIPLAQPGDLRFGMLLNGEPRADYLVTVHQAPPAEALT